MRKALLSLLPVILGIAVLTNVPKAQARISVEIGAEPVCPYGYYDVPPYYCAPYGYYGPEWFADGIFIGAGPWYHGRDHFWGRVDRHFDRDHGYRGALPERGARADRPLGNAHFRGNEHRDGRGHRR